MTTNLNYPGRIPKPPNRKPQPEAMPSPYQRQMPQAPELEKVVLGALLLDRDAFAVVADILKPESFYIDAHRKIYAAFQEMRSNGVPIDLMTATNALQTRGELKDIGGGFYLVELTNTVASAANIEYHARIIAQMWYRRQVIDVANESIKQAYDDSTDAFDLLEISKNKIMGIGPNNTGGAISIGDAAANFLRELDREISGEDVSLVSSGLTDLDRLFRPKKSELLIIAARPGCGKTQTALMYAMQTAKSGGRTHYVSLEMSDEQMAARVICDMTGINGERMRNPKHLSERELGQINQAVNDLQASRITLTGIRTPSGLYQYARRLKSENKIDLLLVDYVQLMNTDARMGNREQEIATISRTLKQISRDLKLPVIALAQLSRAAEMRADKHAVLSDLRESGALEQDADIVMFLQRPEFWGFDDYGFGPANCRSLPAKGLLIVTFGKFRGGDVRKKIALDFTNGQLKNYDWTDYGGHPSTWDVTEYIPKEETPGNTLNDGANTDAFSGARPKLNDADIPF